MWCRRTMCIWYLLYTITRCQITLKRPERIYWTTTTVPFTQILFSNKGEGGGVSNKICILINHLTQWFVTKHSNWPSKSQVLNHSTGCICRNLKLQTVWMLMVHDDVFVYHENLYIVLIGGIDLFFYFQV